MDQLGPDEAPGHRLVPMGYGLVQRVLLKGLVGRAERSPMGYRCPPVGSLHRSLGSTFWKWVLLGLAFIARGYLEIIRAKERLRTWGWTSTQCALTALKVRAAWVTVEVPSDCCSTNYTHHHVLRTC
jgi:hypothetical protein